MEQRKTKALLVTGAALLSAACMFSSCIKSTTPLTPPANPGGYDSANQIQPTSLVAYFSFNLGSFTELEQGLNGSDAGGASFGTGVIGSDYQGSPSANSYVSYSSAGTALPALQSFTLTFWINSAQPAANTTNVVNPGQGTQGIFEIVNPVPVGNYGDLHVDLQPFTSAAGGVTTPNTDTLLLTLEITSTAAGTATVAQQLADIYLDTAVSKWTAVALTYNAATSTLTVYENGNPAGTGSITGITGGPYNGSCTLYAAAPGTASATPLGNIAFPAPSGLVIGAWGVNTPLVTGATPTANNTVYTGGLDELRVYNIPLLAGDVNSLYILEKAGF